MTYLSLYEWFEHNRRVLPWRETTNPYFIWVSEIILQQTRVEQGMAYYYRFIETFPTVEALAQASEDEVLRLWQGLGYYTRARNLHKAAKLIVAESGGGTTFPDTYEGLKALPGVGDYTAGAIASFAYDLPFPALDGNVYRVLSRLTACAIPFDTTEGKHHFHGTAEQLLDRAHPRLFNSALMELGALHCVPLHPDCETCPLQFDCQAYAQGKVDYLPVRKPRPKLTDRYLNYTIYICPRDAESPTEATTLIRQRTGQDIWKHLYEFPLEESDHLFKPEERTSLGGAERYFDVTHILSHQRLHARFFVCRVQALPEMEGGIVTRVSDLDRYALPRLLLKALERVMSVWG